MEIAEKDRARFWSKIDKDGHDLGCWLWTAAITSDGYGQFSIKNKRAPAHRMSIYLLGKDIPDGLVVDHLCRQRRCVNPDHLDVVTNQENLYRGNHRYRDETQCKRGHPFSEGDFYRAKGTGWRNCRKCKRIKHQEKTGKKQLSWSEYLESVRSK